MPKEFLTVSEVMKYLSEAPTPNSKLPVDCNCYFYEVKSEYATGMKNPPCYCRWKGASGGDFCVVIADWKGGIKLLCPECKHAQTQIGGYIGREGG